MWLWMMGKAGATLEVQIGHTFYRLANRGERKVLISGLPATRPGHPPEFHVGRVHVENADSRTRDEAAVVQPALGVITTSRIQEIHDLKPQKLIPPDEYATKVLYCPARF